MFKISKFKQIDTKYNTMITTGWLKYLIFIQYQIPQKIKFKFIQVQGAKISEILKTCVSYKTGSLDRELIDNNLS